MNYLNLKRFEYESYIVILILSLKNHKYYISIKTQFNRIYKANS